MTKTYSQSNYSFLLFLQTNSMLNRWEGSKYVSDFKYVINLNIHKFL